MYAVRLLILCAVASATTGPILAFSFDGTTTSDDGGTTLTPQGTGFTYTAGLNGGQAASFPVGGTAYLTSQPLAALPSGNAPRSVAMWVLPYVAPTGTNGNDGVYLVMWGVCGSVPGLSLGLNLWAGFGATGFFGLAVDGCGVTSWSKVALSVSSWQHVAYTYNGVSVIIYINGAIVYNSATTMYNGLGGTTWTLNTTPNTSLSVGACTCLAAQFLGAVDKLFIYDRALTPSEVAALAVPTASATPSITPSPTPNPSCLPSAYSAYPYADLSGTVLSVTLGAPSEKDCQLACCATIRCTGYSWAGMLPNLACFLFANVTGVTSNVLLNSGVLVAATPPPTPAGTPSRSVPAIVSVSPSVARSTGPARSPTRTAQSSPSFSPSASVAPTQFPYPLLVSLPLWQESDAVGNLGSCNVPLSIGAVTTQGVLQGAVLDVNSCTFGLVNTTISLWGALLPSFFDSSSYANLFALGNTYANVIGGGTNVLFFAPHWWSEPWVGLNGNGNAYQNVADSSLHHYVFLLGKTNAVYLDGHIVWTDTAGYTWVPPASGTMYIGGNVNGLGNQIFIRDFRIYGATLLTSDIQALNTMGPASSTPATPFSSSTPSPTPCCPSSLYRSLPRTDLVGTLVGNAWYPGTSLPSPSESACRQSCCDAPFCDAYTFASNDLQSAIQFALTPRTAACFLYTNVTALVPSSTMSSGALLSAYS